MDESRTTFNKFKKPGKRVKKKKPSREYAPVKFMTGEEYMKTHGYKRSGT